MKRFYKTAMTQPTVGGFAIQLDGKPIMTPKRNPLVVPTAKLAVAVAGEWNAQGEDIDPASMRLTGLSNAAIDIVRPDRENFAANIAKYGESDLLCYRADSPPELVDRQIAMWDPMLIRLEDELGIAFKRVSGVMHQAQPDVTIEVLNCVTGKHDAFTLAALSQIVTITGSLVIGLLAADLALDRDHGWRAAHLDALWQEEQWGTDEEAEKARTHARTNFDAGIDIIELLWVDPVAG